MADDKSKTEEAKKVNPQVEAALQKAAEIKEAAMLKAAEKGALPTPLAPGIKKVGADGSVGTTPVSTTAGDKATGGVAAVAAATPDQKLCWDLKTKGYCPRLRIGIKCPWEHPLSAMMGGGVSSAGASLPQALSPLQQLLAAQRMTVPSSIASVVQNINATAELPEVEGKTIDAPPFVDPPEHLEGAIAGSMRMKRFLEVDMDEGRQEFQRMDLVEELGAQAKSEGLDEPLPKKRRLVTLEPDSLCQWYEHEDEVYMPYTEEEELKLEKIKQILTRWKLTDNYGARYALETAANMKEIDRLLAEVHWKPDVNNHMHSLAELVINRIGDYRKMNEPPMFAVDAIKTFSFKWGIDASESAKLSTLDWKQLKYIFDFYDGTASIDELVDASKAEDDPWGVALPGVQSQVRTMRLELIDGSSDCLVLGDANLTFSSLLADHRANLGHTGKVIATTFEDFKTLSVRYKELARTIKNLLKNDAQIWHGVDCTRLAVDPRFHGFEEAFGAVYYNFPHAGAVRGFYDSHPFVNWRHANLMALFFRAISYFVKPDAIVKVSSNARAKGVQAQYIIMAAEYSDFMHIETFAFTDWVLRRYHRSYGDKRDEKVRPGADSYTSQQAHADMVYCFRYIPTGQKESTGVPIKQPPEILDFIDDVLCCACGYICQKEMVSKQQGATGAINSSVHFSEQKNSAHSNVTGKAKRKAVLEFYQRFLTEASGIHIG